MCLDVFCKAGSARLSTDCRLRKTENMCIEGMLLLRPSLHLRRASSASTPSIYNPAQPLTHPHARVLCEQQEAGQSLTGRGTPCASHHPYSSHHGNYIPTTVTTTLPPQRLHPYHRNDYIPAIATTTLHSYHCNDSIPATATTPSLPR
eukprot:scaffold3685_cov242-Pinguiococcus_pyrenoidosus.AAC.11